MKEKRFTHKDWQEIFQDDSSPERVSVTEADELSRMMEQVGAATETALSQQDRDRLFERAWKWSAPPENEPVSWFARLQPLVLKPAFIFVLGIIAGIWLTVQYESGNLDIAQEVQAEEPLIIEKSMHQQTLKGKAVEQVYPYAENPVIVIEKSPDRSRVVRRVLYATLNDGEITYVNNLYHDHTEGEIQ